METFKIKSGGTHASEITNRVESALSLRQTASLMSFTPDEIRRISSATRKLVSKNVKIPGELLESLRAAATLANSDLRPNPDFSSHRPLIGWAIVAIKRLTWPLVRFHLHRHFDNQSELNRWTLYNQVKLYEAAIERTSSNTTQSAR